MKSKEAGFSIDLDIDLQNQLQLTQPFFVSTVNQDGFASGRLDSLEVDASGPLKQTIQMVETNHLGKLLANFNGKTV